MDQIRIQTIDHPFPTLSPHKLILSLSPLSDCDPDGILHHGASQLLHSFWERGAEQRADHTWPSAGLDDGVDLVHKTELEQLVGLVQHQMYHSAHNPDEGRTEPISCMLTKKNGWKRATEYLLASFILPVFSPLSY